MNMETPFLYGRIAENENFTNRRNETEFLKKNFKGLINTVIISPRRWGKASLVHKVAKLISEEEKDVIICQVDIFNCRTEEEFYTVFANSLLKSTTTVWEEFVGGVKKYLGRLAPIVSISDATQTYELSFGIEFKDSRLSYDEILDLPQVIANDTKKRIVILTGFKISMNMKNHWLFNVNFVPIGKSILQFVIVCMVVSGICC